MARAKGFDGYRINFPTHGTGAWTVMATTMGGDITNPARDRTMHVDAMTGDVIADVGFQDYSLMGKAMAAGVPLHQGSLGAWNIIANIVFCLIIILMTLSGLAMWWMRRPKNGFRLAPPPVERGMWRSASAVMLLGALLFPLTAVALALVIAADFAVSRAQTVKR